MTKLLILCGRQNIPLHGKLTNTKIIYTFSHYIAELDPLLKENVSYMFWK